MNTPKYGISNSRQGSVSPFRQQSKPNRYFSVQEVNKLLKTHFEPKLQFLMQQLEDRQQLIAKLNNQLNENDEKLLQLKGMVENFSRKNKDTQHWQSYLVGTVNQLINDKSKQGWQTLNVQIKTLGQKINTDLDTKRIQILVNQEMQRLKTTVDQFMDTHKKKSNSYWQKIKQALNKINSKVVSTQKDIIDVHARLQNFQQERTKDRDIINELQNSKHVVKNLIQLRKSVDNIYGNYQAILNLQKGLKQRLEDQGDSLWHQSQFIRTSSKLAFPQDLIALEYSREEIPQNTRNISEEWKNYSNVNEMIPSPNRPNDPNRSASELFPLQRTTPMKGQEPSEIFSLNTSHQMNSKIHNSTILLNHSLETRKEMTLGVRERLLELIEAKGLSRPLNVRYDAQINYLKSTEGNYLFDTKGNMFKLSPNDLQLLEKEGLINRSHSPSRPSEKVKRTIC